METDNFEKETESIPNSEKNTISEKESVLPSFELSEADSLKVSNVGENEAKLSADENKDAKSSGNASFGDASNNPNQANEVPKNYIDSILKNYENEFSVSLSQKEETIESENETEEQTLLNSDTESNLSGEAEEDIEIKEAVAMQNADKEPDEAILYQENGESEDGNIDNEQAKSYSESEKDDDTQDDLHNEENDIEKADYEKESTDAEYSEDSEEEQEEEEEKGYDPEKPRLIDTVFDFVELFIFSLAAVLILTTFVFRHSIVEGSSMEQTLFGNEHIIISDLFYTPKRGDIIVCEDYTTVLRKPIVKRVIAIEGDHVQVSSDGLTVKVNGELIEEDYVYVDPGAFIDKGTVDMIVPEGEIFVMGDHRNMSTDSRDIGTVREDSVLGKVLLRFYPFEKFGKVE